MESMIERVAKALCDEARGEHGCGGFCRAMAEYGPAARAAIEAMREPTKAMIRANGTSPVEAGQRWLDEDARVTWQAMIDAALAE